jgi:hypothetical protein
MKVTFSPILNPYFFLSLDGITICPFVLILDVSIFLHRFTMFNYVLLIYKAAMHLPRHLSLYV